MKFVQVDDYVISLRSFQGGLEHSRYAGLVSPAYNVIRLRDEYNQPSYRAYYKYLFKSPHFITLLNTIVSGIRDGKNINFSDLGELLIPVPTSVEIDTFHSEFLKLEQVRSQFDHEKKLLSEYRTRLIADVVTGKIDVRGVPVLEMPPEWDTVGAETETDDKADADETNDEMGTKDAES